MSDSKTIVTIIRFEIEGSKEAVKFQTKDKSIKDTIGAIIEDEISDIFPPPDYYIHCNSVVVLGKTLFVSIHTYNKKIDYTVVAKFIKKRFDHYFKKNKDGSHPYPEALKLKLENIEIEPSLSALKKKISLPGFKVKHIEYADEPGHEDEIIVTLTRDYKSRK